MGNSCQTCSILDLGTDAPSISPSQMKREINSSSPLPPEYANLDPLGNHSSTGLIHLPEHKPDAQRNVRMDSANFQSKPAAQTSEPPKPDGPQPVVTVETQKD